mmetsp:Transcript_82518/g.145644  ORF Transcript_82518/g.145644 Transcript_82518/m.145644 type:complete len:255 (-) Transcript_82518:51-815(-)
MLPPSCETHAYRYHSDGIAGVCVLGLSGGGTWHGLEFKESVSFSSSMKRLIDHPSYEYKVQKEGVETNCQAQSNSTVIKERGSYNEVVSTRSLFGKPFVMDRLSSITHYMQKLLNHFEFEDWRSFTEDELKHPIGGFHRKVLQAYRPMEEHIFVMDKLTLLERFDKDIASKEGELDAHSAAGDHAKRGGAQRQVNNLKKQRETAVAELSQYKQKVLKVRQDARDKLEASQTWNRSCLTNLMHEFDEQAVEYQQR